MMTQWQRDSMKKMYWSNGAKMMAKRVQKGWKAAKLEMEVIKKINASVEQMAKETENCVTMREPNDCAKWQWDLLMEQENEDL